MIKKTITITDVSIPTLTNQEKTLINTAKEAVFKAYAPYSKFKVGAAVLLENGEIITGSNQENAAYPSGTCAERVALFYANSLYPNISVAAIAIAAFTNNKYVQNPISPCGACRQVLSEVELRQQKPITIYLYGESDIFMLESTKHLLPLHFIL